MKRTFLILLGLFQFMQIWGQSLMEEGFRYLELGQFAKAEIFFEGYLKKDPGNKTALICYGRAVGLNGRPELAQERFSQLLNEYPNDLEVKLNYNESLLWDKRFSEAKPLYAVLVRDYPTNFAAVLGYANTLSNLKEYKAALEWVEKALRLQPNDPGAKTSKKYIHLGYADQCVKQQRYNQGEVLLKGVFKDFPNDQETLLNLANLYIIKKEVESARNAYRDYVNLPKDSIKALNGMALVEHIDGKDKRALQLAALSKQKIDGYDDPPLREQTYNRYVQALIWNRKFVKAKKMIDSLFVREPDRDWILALRATLGLYTGDPNSSIRDYERILVEDSASFDGNLGLANALFASGRIKPAYGAAYRTLYFFPNQKDATLFLEKISLGHVPGLDQHFGYSFDNGKNVAFFSNTEVKVPLSTQLGGSLAYGYRTTKNTGKGNRAYTHSAIGGLWYRPWPRAVLEGKLGLNISDYGAGSYTQPILKVQLATQTFKLHRMTAIYHREMQNFNADLIAREIVMQHYRIDYNLGTNFGMGWFNQLMFTTQNDGNERKLLFTSLYYNLMLKPLVKFGVNYQYMGFADQVPTIYFSPERFQAIEIFGEFKGNLAKNTELALLAATGRQKVEEDPLTNTLRADLSVKQRFSKRLEASVYGRYSNIASATAAGFEYSEFGLRLSWKISKTPIFKFTP
ncbi:tetratricopeptide repeat protein [Sediminicola luteus]|uniref:Uncharacterized protein n=1 Tax=Sediminicola luteus TaxID=319238 RepID=A0A2A4G259_9FLAO|nr:tetratricopeptide repeat protein [Sediminicola luteus]PCE62521.1 hypothetical protein B7P33_17955 [Sediminicola luteus]